MQYWIEKIDFEDGGIGIATLSCDNHLECVTVYGDREALTARVLLLLKGLNNEHT
jgi:hypothetical protein